MAAAPKSRANTAMKRRQAPALAGLPAIPADATVLLGARISRSTHRQLKLAAVVCGETVQTLVEQAVREFLTTHPELQQTGEPKSRRARR